MKKVLMVSLIFIIATLFSLGCAEQVEITEFDYRIENQEAILTKFAVPLYAPVLNVRIPEEIDGYPVVGIDWSLRVDGSIRDFNVYVPQSIRKIYHFSFGTDVYSNILCDVDSDMMKWILENSDGIEYGIRIDETWYRNYKWNTEEGDHAFQNTLENQSEVTKRFIYLNAQKYYQKGRYDEAIVGFDYLQDYKDSTLYLKNCRRDKDALYNYDFSLSNDGIVVSKYIGYEKNIIVPYGVCKIAGFNNYSRLETIELPDTLTEIGTNTFKGCTSLLTIDIPTSVKKIGRGAFSESGILEIRIPHLVESIDLESFRDCSSLQMISFEEPSVIKSIGDKAFQNCTNLKEIKIPDSVEKIDMSAFEGCVSLITVILPDNIRSLDSYVFKNCKSLETINLPDTLTVVEYEMFEGCKKLQDVHLSKNLKQIKQSAFADCSSLTSISIPDTVQEIGLCQ